MNRKVAVVNGASGGIGSIIAQTLVEDYDLVLLGRNKDKLEALTSHLKAIVSDAVIEYFVVDFTIVSEIQQVAQALSKYAGAVKALVNSVGIVPVGGISVIDESTWENSIQVSLMSAVRLVKYFNPLMCDGGSIVLVNGVLALEPDAGFVVSSTITGALRNFAKAISKEFAKRDIRVNSVLPGATKTSLWDNISSVLGERNALTSEDITKAVSASNPMNRIAEPQDIANVVMFLTTDKAKYVNGAMITVDGGASVSA